MDRKIRIAQYGCGKMSHYLMRYVLEKGGELVAAFDMNPAMIGTDIGTHLGMEKLGITISYVIHSTYVPYSRLRLTPKC